MWPGPATRGSWVLCSNKLAKCGKILQNNFCILLFATQCQRLTDQGSVVGPPGPLAGVCQCRGESTCQDPGTRPGY
eukprot:3771202-Rhodomonas_salina.3